MNPQGNRSRFPGKLPPSTFVVASRPAARSSAICLTCARRVSRRDIPDAMTRSKLTPLFLTRLPQHVQGLRLHVFLQSADVLVQGLPLLLAAFTELQMVEGISVILLPTTPFLAEQSRAARPRVGSFCRSFLRAATFACGAVIRVLKRTRTLRFRIAAEPT